MNSPSQHPAPDPTLVIAAIPEELAALKRRLVSARPVRQAPVAGLVSGLLGGRPVIVGATGDGARLAGRAASALLAATGARRLIAIGVAGAASSGLGPGDLVVADRVLSPRGSVYDGDAGPVAWLPGATPAVFVTLDRIADTPAAKRGALAAARAVASIEAVIVDMESAAWVEAAQRAGADWTVVRCVSDAADEALPSLFERARGADGAIDRTRVVAGLLAEPSLVPTLLRLRARVNHCAERLAWAVEALVTQAASPGVTTFVAMGEGEGARRGEGT